LYHVWATKTTPALTLAWRIVACRPGTRPSAGQRQKMQIPVLLK
jgi:hypothetical protein